MMEETSKQKNNNNSNPAMKPEELPIEIVAKVEELPIEVQASLDKTQQPTKYPAIKSMIEKLDKFLSRRIAAIAVIYLVAMVALGSGLIANGVISNAHIDGGSSKKNEINIWLYSVIATLSLIILLIVIRVITFRVAKSKKK